MIRELTAGCFIPVTVGGGVRTLDDIDALLRAGADKVSICAGYAKRPDFVTEASQRFGRQAIVVVLEHSEDTTARALCIRARNAEIDGAGEIVLQCRERDGTLFGYCLNLISEASAVVRTPIVASGGCSGAHDMLDAINAGADACAAGALFQFEGITPRECATYLQSNGIEVRT